jgi:hypothetical protein
VLPASRCKSTAARFLRGHNGIATIGLVFKLFTARQSVNWFGMQKSENHNKSLPWEGGPVFPSAREMRKLRMLENTIRHSFEFAGPYVPEMLH